MAPLDPDADDGVVCAIVSTGMVVSSASERLFGLATFTPGTRAFQLCEFHEDTRLSRTEALLLQVQPRSCCVLMHDADDLKKLSRVAESCDVALTELKNSDVKNVEVEQDLLRLLKGTEGCGLGRHLEEQRQKQGMRALATLLGYHSIVSEPALFGSCTLSLYPLRSFMHLDKAAFSALNILPRIDESLRSSTSLLGFLNRCRSDVGTRRLRQWLTQPLTSMDEISRRQDVVEAFSRADGLLRQVEAFFRHVPDLEKVANRFHRLQTTSKWAKATIEDMVNLYQCVVGMQQLVTALTSYEGVHKDVLSETIVAPLQKCLADFTSFRALVEQTIDLVQAEQRTYCISTAFDATLRDLGMQRDKIRDQMEVLRNSVDADLKLVGAGRNEKVLSLSECPDGQCFRVTKKNQVAIQSHKGKYKLKMLSIKKNECMFTTPEMEKLNDQFHAAISAYDLQSKQLADKALKVAATYTPVMERLAELLGNLDALGALARVVLSAPCQFCRATIDPESKTFAIKGASHVLVVANSEKSFVANDLDMDRDSSRLHIITGPNMGGKSTYIRSVALIALLNQIGSFVPCQSAKLPLFDSVMCRVGASDMQLRGISTFMAEMLEAASILNTATERSLVIVDELGRGTSTSDGFGIAWAIARHLAETTRCFALFATHFHELAGLEDMSAAVHNKHATASVDTVSGQLTFLYALASGAADQSYGAHVAELAGFPKGVVDAARRRAVEFESAGDFGKSVKRRRVSATTSGQEENASHGDAVAFVMAAPTEDEFVSRALGQLPHLEKAVAGASECGG